MRFLHAQQQAQARGWELVDWQSKEDRNGVKHTCSHIYAVRGEEQILLCSFSDLWLMGRSRWTQIMDEKLSAEAQEVNA